MSDRLFIAALRLVPKNALSRLVGALTRWRAPAPVRLAAMRAFAARYGIDLSECPGLEVYRSFGEFFARPLRPGLRPVASGERVLVSPVDAVVSEAGVATKGRLVQAKGIDYPAAALLATPRTESRPAEVRRKVQLAELPDGGVGMVVDGGVVPLPPQQVEAVVGPDGGLVPKRSADGGYIPVVDGGR